MNLLQRIKGSSTASGKLRPRRDAAFRPMRNAHVVGAYVFRKADLKTNQVFFNDGVPSVIFMPRGSDVVHLRSSHRPNESFRGAWVCCGEIKETYWETPEELDYILVLRFKPSAFFSLFNVEPATFEGRPVRQLEDIVNERWNDVINQYYQQPTLAGRLRLLDDKLLAHRISAYFPPMLNLVLDYIEEKKGNTTVAEIDRMLGKGINAKWLHRNFVRYLGIAPKRYISLQRFIYCYELYQKDRTRKPVAAMSLLGYYDYNHFVKDFKYYIGIAPSRHMWE